MRTLSWCPKQATKTLQSRLWIPELIGNCFGPQSSELRNRKPKRPLVTSVDCSVLELLGEPSVYADMNLVLIGSRLASLGADWVHWKPTGFKRISREVFVKQILYRKPHKKFAEQIGKIKRMWLRCWRPKGSPAAFCCFLLGCYAMDAYGEWSETEVTERPEVYRGFCKQTNCCGAVVSCGEQPLQSLFRNAVCKALDERHA